MICECIKPRAFSVFHSGRQEWLRLPPGNYRVEVVSALPEDLYRLEDQQGIWHPISASSLPCQVP